MHIENLIFEVTRKCNMNCKHCLRGNAQCMSMSKKTIENALKDVTSIYSLQFTGGEPLLGIYQIRTICETIIKNNISLGCFWLKTNGSVFSKAVLDYLNNLFVNIVEEQELSSIEFSVDQFHNKQIQNNIYAYMEMKEYYGYDFIQRPLRENQRINYLINEGRAKRVNGFNKRIPTYKSGWLTYDEEDYDYDALVYISSNGNVMSDCDLSFKNIDKYSFGNVNKESLKDIIERNTSNNIYDIEV